MCLLFWSGYMLTDHSWLVQWKARVKRSPELFCCWGLRWKPRGWHMEALRLVYSDLRWVGCTW